MSALDLAQISACLASMDRQTLGLTNLPMDVLAQILDYCDLPSQMAAAKASNRLAMAVSELRKSESVAVDCNCNLGHLSFGDLPADVLLLIFQYLNRQEMGRLAQVSSRFRNFCYSDCLWLEEARSALGSNQRDVITRARSQEILTARDKVKVGEMWRRGQAREGLVAVQSTRFMPRLQLEAKRLWVSWGSKIWCHPRLPGGGIAKTTCRMLRGHSDDVSKFVVAQGMVVSGGRDRSIRAWSASTGEFLFARRYCHRDEVTAVEVAGGGSVLVTGSRDSTAIVWSLTSQHGTDNQGLLPLPLQQHHTGDRVWAVGVSPCERSLAVGTAATRGVPPLRIYDLPSGAHTMDLGTGLRAGAGMLDLSWLSPYTLLACGYDTFTRLWDTRCGGAVQAWEEEYDESVYCLATDRVNCLVTGTSRHGRVRVWDMRSPNHLYMRHAAPARRGQSSPVYSLAMDSSNLYVALDQSLNHFGFGERKGEDKGRTQGRIGDNQMTTNYKDRFRNRNNFNTGRY